MSLRGPVWGYMLAAAMLSGSFSPVLAVDLEQQLDIRPHNATEGQARDVADQWMRLGQRQAAAGQGEDAIAAWLQAADIYRALGDTEAEGQVYGYIGSTYVDLGQYPQAETLLRRQLAIARDNRDLLQVVTSLNSLGSLLLQNNQLVEAEALFTEGLQIAEAVPFPSGIGMSLSNLGLVAALRNDVPTAVRYLETATNYRFRSSDLLGEAYSSNNLGNLYQALGRQGEAVGAYRVALRAGEDFGNVPVQLRAIDGLLKIYLDRQSWADVRTYLDRRAALTLSNPSPTVETVRTLIWFGEYYERAGEVAAAKETYNRALGLARTLSAAPQVSDLTNRLIYLNRS